MKTVFIAVSFLLACASALAQPQVSRVPGIPRLPTGEPDFSGVWAGPAFTHNAGSGDTDTPRVTNFDRNRMAPFLPGAEAKFRQAPTGDVRHDDPTEVCLPDGHPREALAPYAQQIVQTPDTVVFLYEYMHFFRVIPINQRHPPEVDLTFMGDSVATWEGDTLLIDTIGLREWPLSASNGWHSDALHTIERLRHLDAATVSYEITVDDPKIFTKPWSQTFVMKRHPTWKLLEQVCEENNRCEAGKCADSPPAK